MTSPDIGFSPATLEDGDLVYRLLQSAEDPGLMFFRCIPSLLALTGYLGALVKFWDGENLIFFFVRAGLNPQFPIASLYTPSRLGPGAVQATVDLARTLQGAVSGRITMVADDAEMGELQKLGFAAEQSRPGSLRLSLSGLCDLRGNELANVRQMVHRIERAGHLRVEELAESNYRAAIEVMAAWHASYPFEAKDEASRSFATHDLHLRFFLGGALRNGVGEVIYLDDAPIAVFVAEEFVGDYGVGHVAFALREVRGSSEYVYHRMAARLSVSGCKYEEVGSGTPGLLSFKRKLGVEREVGEHHVSLPPPSDRMVASRQRVEDLLQAAFNSAAENYRRLRNLPGGLGPMWAAGI